MTTSQTLRMCAAGAVALLALTACGADPEPQQEAPTTIEPETGVDKGAAPGPELPAVWPLTGVAAEVAERPAVAVKVENSSMARPQTGLEQADIVWEELVEGGITRFNAVYHSQVPEVIGPIRSVRPMDAAIAAPTGGLMVFSGGQGPFVQLMRDVGLQVLSNDEGAPGMYRTSDRRAPHNVYGSMEVFLEQADGGRAVPPPAQFAFALRPELATAVTAGEPAARLVTSFPSASPNWTWEGGAWQRFEGSSPAVTSAGDQLAATNVVIMRVDIRDVGVPETVLEGSGEAFVATGGMVVAATWTKGGPGDPVVLTAADGSGVELAPGATWVELVPNAGGAVEIS